MKSKLCLRTLKRAVQKLGAENRWVGKSLYYFILVEYASFIIISLRLFWKIKFIFIRKNQIAYKLFGIHKQGKLAILVEIPEKMCHFVVVNIE